MSDPISGKIAADIAQAGLTQASPQGPGPANPSDVAQFNEAMQAPMPPEQSAPVQGAESPLPDGESSLIKGVDDMSANMRTMQNDLQNLVNNTGGEVGDLLKTQFQVAQLTMAQTMVGQVGQKTSQGTQQLLKGQ